MSVKSEYSKAKEIYKQTGENAIYLANIEIKKAGLDITTIPVEEMKKYVDVQFEKYSLKESRDALKELEIMVILEAVEKLKGDINKETEGLREEMIAAALKVLK